MENTMKPAHVVTIPATHGYASASSHALVPSLRGRTSGFGALADGNDVVDFADAIDSRGTRAWSPPT